MRRFEREVSAGIRFLDVSRKVPTCWRLLIDIDTLNMEYLEDCILGQLFNNFGDGQELLDLDDSTTEELGLSLEDADDSDNYKLLTKEWRRQLARDEGKIRHKSITKRFGFKMRRFS